MKKPSSAIAIVRDTLTTRAFKLACFMIPAFILALSAREAVRAPQFDIWRVYIPWGVSDILIALATATVVHVLRIKVRYLLGVFLCVLAMSTASFQSLLPFAQTPEFQNVADLGKGAAIGILYCLAYMSARGVTKAMRDNEYRKSLFILRSIVILPFLLLMMFVYFSWDFERRMASSPQGTGLPKLGIVFTGKYERVWMGLRLMKNGDIQRLFISGANRVSGVPKDGFIEQFVVQGELLNDLINGRIALGELATDTFQNAMETACWLEQNEHGDQVLLITSESHMPRASVALEQHLSGIKVSRLSVPEDVTDGPSSYLLWTEFRKYLGTSIVSRSPKKLRSYFEVQYGVGPVLICR